MTVLGAGVADTGAPSEQSVRVNRRWILLLVTGVVLIAGAAALALADVGDSNRGCQTRGTVTVCVKAGSPFSPSASGLEPGSELRIAIAEEGMPLGDPLVVRADASGNYPGTQGVAGIVGADRVSTVSFSGTSSDGKQVTVAVSME